MKRIRFNFYINYLAFWFLLSGIFAVNTICGAQTVSASSRKKETVKKTVSAAGDCTLGVDSRYNSVFNEYYRVHGSPYFLQKVKKIF